MQGVCGPSVSCSASRAATPAHPSSSYYYYSSSSSSPLPSPFPSISAYPLRSQGASSPSSPSPPARPVPAGIVARLAGLSTCALADALQELKVQGVLPRVQLLPGYAAPGRISVCGPAYTITFTPVGGAELPKLSQHYADLVPAGAVAVISSPWMSDPPASVCGGLVATQAHLRGVAGLVTNGYVRDLHELHDLNFPAFATGTAVHGTRGRLAMTATGTPIVLNGVTVRPGDIVRADLNGAVVIPIEHAENVASRAEKIEEQDKQIGQDIRSGILLTEAMASRRNSAGAKRPAARL